jgi:parallel beta-helix repeat protein
MRKFKVILFAVSISLVLALGAFPIAVSAKPVTTLLTPQPAGTTGLYAAYIAKAGEHISGMTIDSSTVNGLYDIGIYIAADNVTVTGTTISGANNEGILVQGATNVVIRGSKITGNATDNGDYDGYDPITNPGGLTEDKAIVLAGTTNCIVQGNLVEGNGHGGIAVLDDGPNHPFAPEGTSDPIPGIGNLIKANTVQNNAGDCGIVIAAKNPGGGVSDNTVSENQVLAPEGLSPYINGIIVAGGAFGPVNVTDTLIKNNTVDGGDIPGISIHAFGPGNITGTQLIGNTLSNNGAGELSGDTTGIEIFAVPGVGIISGTLVLNDYVSNEYYGLWHVGDTDTQITNLQTNNVTASIFP